MQIISNSIEEDLESAYKLLVDVIRRLGYDVDNENFRKTPYRCRKAFLEDFILPKKELSEQAIKLIDTTFPAKCDEMITQLNIRVISLCPHHLLPVEMFVNIGYIPDKKVLGLSKLARLAILLGKQPILQEDYTSTLANVLNVELKPKGVAIYIKGMHGCMNFRGVKAENIWTVTSKVIGAFKKQSATRGEFMAMCRSNNGK